MAFAEASSSARYYYYAAQSPTASRCGVIVPDGVLFGSSKAHKQLRQLLLEKCQLEGIVSMPSGVFRPYAGVSTAVLIFAKGGSTERVWFYKMEKDGNMLNIVWI